MKENEIVYHIHENPDIIKTENGTFELSTKIAAIHVKKVNELILNSLREVMKENGITDFYAIDEEQVMDLIKEHKALKLIVEKIIPLVHLKSVRLWGESEPAICKAYDSTFTNVVYFTEEEYNLLLEVIEKLKENLYND